jgi:hypothetical protein
MEIRPPKSKFDTRGFFFFASFLACLVLILLSAKSVLSSGIISPTTPVLGSLVSFVNAGDMSDTSTFSDASPVTAKTPSSPRRFINIKTVKESIPESGKFIGVDLQAMKLYLYEDGVLESEYPVVSKGRPGSRWETPSGSYEVLYKNPAHFSSIGEVYMPWSMQFYGNFFIHGWPYYPDGTEVGEGYSGGCIRLTTEDAEKVFAFADIHTPIYVYDSDLPPIEGANFDEDTSRNITHPRVGANAYLVADLESGEVYLEKNATEVYPIASISKLMTAVVANETISFASYIPVTEYAFNTYGSLGGLEVGDRLTIGEMYYPLLLSSSNDAAQAIADFRGGADFVRLMNQKARALDMADTSFGDPSGLSPANVSSVSDLFKLARYIDDRKRFIFDISMQLEEEAPATDYVEARTYKNNHPMKDHPSFIGGKNGFTDEAQKTLLSLFKVQTKEGQKKIAIIVLGTPDSKTDTTKLLEATKDALN